MSFPARYPGPCALPFCAGIQPDDEIVRAPTNAAAPFQHLPGRCPEQSDPLAVERTPCPRCYTVPTPSGACMCEDA